MVIYNMVYGYFPPSIQSLSISQKELAVFNAADPCITSIQQL